MKGQQPPQPSLFACVRLEEMIPSDHLLRRIQQAIDFTFIDRLTEPLYSGMGRPSVPPQPNDRAEGDGDITRATVAVTPVTKTEVGTAGSLGPKPAWAGPSDDGGGRPPLVEPGGLPERLER